MEATRACRSHTVFSVVCVLISVVACRASDGQQALEVPAALAQEIASLRESRQQGAVSAVAERNEGLSRRSTVQNAFASGFPPLAAAKQGAALAIARKDAVKDAVVVKVDGVNVTDESIRVPREDAVLRFKLTRGHEPQGEAESAEVGQIKQRLESERLAEKIRQIVFERQQHRLGVTVTDQEVQARWEKLTKGVDKDAAVQQQRETIGPLLNALQAVYEKGMNEHAAYQQFVARRMSREEWTIQLNYYRTPERRHILVNAMNQSASDLSRPDAGVASMLRQEKMNDAVDREIAGRDAEFRRYQEALAKGEIPEGRFPPNYLEIKRHAWWSDQYRRANIIVVDERYRSVVDGLRAPAGEANTPTRQSQPRPGCRPDSE